MDELTDQQIMEFWELFGFREDDTKRHYHYERGIRVVNWLYPDGTFHRDLPSLRGLEAPGNLFKWAVSELQSEYYITLAYDRFEKIWRGEIAKDESYVTMEDKDPTSALLLTIIQVIKEAA
jgi:hypothetical protein